MLWGLDYETDPTNIVEESIVEESIVDVFPIMHVPE